MPLITASELLDDFIGPNVNTGDLGLPEVPDNWGSESGGYISDWNPVDNYTDPTWGGMSNAHGINRVFPWWVILCEKTYNPSGANFRVHLRQMRSYRRVSGAWTVHETLLDPRGGAKDYRMPGDVNYDFSETSHGGYSGRLTTPSSGGMALEMINDWAGHGFPLGFLSPNYSTWEAVGVTIFGRLVPKDAAQVFDWENYRVVLDVGTDNYQDSSWRSEHAHGRFKRLTNKWQVFGSATVKRPSGKPDQGPGLTVTQYNTAPMPLPPEEGVWLERGAYNSTTGVQTLVLKRSAAVGSNKTYNFSSYRGSFTGLPSSLVMTSGSSSVQFDVTVSNSTASNTIYVSDGSNEDHWGTFLAGSGTATGDPGGGGGGGGTATLKVNGIDMGAAMAQAGARPLGSQKQYFMTLISASLGVGPFFEIRVGGVVKYKASFPGEYLVVDPNYITFKSQLIEPPTVNVADPLTASDCVMAIVNNANSAIEIIIPLKVNNTAINQASATKALDGTNPIRFATFQLLAPNTLDVNTGGTGEPGTSTFSLNTLISDMTLANDNNWGLEQAPNTDTGTSVYAQITVGISRGYGNSGYPNAYISDSSLPGNNNTTITMTDTSTVRLLGWYVVGRAKQSTVRSSNSRVQIRNHKMIALLTNGTWMDLSSSDTGIQGASWHANFWTPGNEDYLAIGDTPGSALYQYRNESSGNGGGQSLGSIGYGGWGTQTASNGTILNKYASYALHGYPISYSNTRRWWIDNVRGFIQYLEARLIVHDTNAADDRANANLLVWSGADWYVNNIYVIDGAGVGRLKMVTTDWRVFAWHNLNSTLLMSNPPPGFS